MRNKLLGDYTTLLCFCVKFLLNNSLCKSNSSVGKESACSAWDPGSIPGLGRSPGEGNGNPLQPLCNLMNCSIPGNPVLRYWNLLRVTSIESAMLSNHLILCRPLLLLLFKYHTILKQYWAHTVVLFYNSSLHLFIYFENVFPFCTTWEPKKLRFVRSLQLPKAEPPRDCPGGPVAETPCSQCRESGFKLISSSIYSVNRHFPRRIYTVSVLRTWCDTVVDKTEPPVLKKLCSRKWKNTQLTLKCRLSWREPVLPGWEQWEVRERRSVQS